MADQWQINPQARFWGQLHIGDFGVTSSGLALTPLSSAPQLVYREKKKSCCYSANFWLKTSISMVPNTICKWIKWKMKQM
jgi:hypothetical protein